MTNKPIPAGTNLTKIPDNEFSLAVVQLTYEMHLTDTVNLTAREIAYCEEVLMQSWIIDGEWSEYHHMVAKQDGWALTQKQGMWEITTNDEKKFPTDNDAREFVLANEFNEENTIYGYAINAIMVGNVRG